MSSFHPRLVLTLVLMAGPMTACEMVETSRQLPDSGYVTLDRAPVGWLLQVDEAEPVPLQGMSQGVRYALPAGRHRIRLLEGPEIRYDRFIFVSAGQVVPVEVPR